MKLYAYKFGDNYALAPGKDDQDAYEKRVDIDPTYEYLPVKIAEVELEGYTITVTAEKSPKKKAE